MISPARSPLRRFVTDGLRDTIDSFTADNLPLHRFVWELDSRLKLLAELAGPTEHDVVAAMSSAHQTIATIHRRRGHHRPLSVSDKQMIISAITTLRAMITRLERPDYTRSSWPSRAHHQRPSLIA